MKLISAELRPFHFLSLPLLFSHFRKLEQLRKGLLNLYLFRICCYGFALRLGCKLKTRVDERILFLLNWNVPKKTYLKWSHKNEFSLHEIWLRCLICARTVQRLNRTHHLGNCRSVEPQVTCVNPTTDVNYTSVEIGGSFNLLLQLQSMPPI